MNQNDALFSVGTALELFPLEHIPYACPDLSAIVSDALAAGSDAIEIGFPEMSSESNATFSMLRQILFSSPSNVPVFVNLPLNGCQSGRDIIVALQHKLNRLGLRQAEYCTFGPISRRIAERLSAMNIDKVLNKMMEEGLIQYAGFRLCDRVEYISMLTKLSNKWYYVRVDYDPLDYLDRPGAYSFVAAKEFGLQLMIGAAPLYNRSYPALSRQFSDSNFNLNNKLLEWFAALVPNALQVITPQPGADYSSQKATIQQNKNRPLSVSELMLRNDLRDSVSNARAFSCTACGCCMPCPQGIDIPGIMTLYNEIGTSISPAVPLLQLQLLDHDPTLCTHCGKCIQACPRTHDIPKVMEYFCTRFLSNL